MGNWAKARKIWGRLQGILIREGATKRVSGNFLKAMVQQELMFGVETWVVSPMMERALSAFIHGSARRLAGRQPRKGRDGGWYYWYVPPIFVSQQQRKIIACIGMFPLTGRRWRVIWQRPGRVGRGCRGSLAGRSQQNGCRVTSSRRWCSRCRCLGRIHGWCP